MKVYIRELARTATLYLYSITEEDCAEEFILKFIGTQSGVIEPMTDEIRAEVPAGLDVSSVKYVVSEEYYRALVPIIEQVQECYDKTRDEMIDAECSLDDMIEYLEKNGISGNYFVDGRNGNGR